MSIKNINVLVFNNKYKILYNFLNVYLFSIKLFFALIETWLEIRVTNLCFMQNVQRCHVA